MDFPKRPHATKPPPTHSLHQKTQKSHPPRPPKPQQTPISKPKTSPQYPAPQKTPTHHTNTPHQHCTIHTTTTTSHCHTRKHPTTSSGETIRVPHDLQHAHERKAIRTFLHEQPQRRAYKKNCDKKHYRKKIKNHTNNNLIVNLTNDKIAPPLLSILSKGLNFVPTPAKTHIHTILNSFEQFRRSMYIHYHFRNFTTTHPNPFKTKSSWKPPLPDNTNLLSYIASVSMSIHHIFRSHSLHPTHSNLNQEEINFLAKHNPHNQKYIIKPADKGGAIVIWSTSDYEKEALSQLNDKRYYQKMQAEPHTVIATQTNKITQYIKDLFKYEDIDYKTLQYLLPPSPPRTPIFYLLPKIHKPNNPGRPIISGCDSPTDRLSSFIDSYLKQLCTQLPSYIKDTNHFLQTIFNIPTPLPPNTILATIDVKSLYTNIPHNEGIRATLEALDNKHGRMWPLRKIIHQFLEYILKENYFTFKNQLYLQKHGTAMGTKMAPSYANIFMGT